MSVSASLIGDADKAAVSYSVAGLDGDATATVTFEDINGDQVTVEDVTANGDATVDLSVLADGSITVSVSVRELAVVEPDWEVMVAQRFWSPVLAPLDDPEKFAAERVPEKRPPEVTFSVPPMFTLPATLSL